MINTSIINYENFDMWGGTQELPVEQALQFEQDCKFKLLPTPQWLLDIVTTPRVTVPVVLKHQHEHDSEEAPYKASPQSPAKVRAVPVNHPYRKTYKQSVSTWMIDEIYTLLSDSSKELKTKEIYEHYNGSRTISAIERALRELRHKSKIFYIKQSGGWGVNDIRATQDLTKIMAIEPREPAASCWG